MKGSKILANKNHLYLENSNKFTGSSKKNLPFLSPKSHKISSYEESTIYTLNFEPSSIGITSSTNNNSITNSIKLNTRKSLNLNTSSKDNNKVTKFTQKFTIENILPSNTEGSMTTPKERKLISNPIKEIHQSNKFEVKNFAVNQINKLQSGYALNSFKLGMDKKVKRSMRCNSNSVNFDHINFNPVIGSTNLKESKLFESLESYSPTIERAESNKNKSRVKSNKKIVKVNLNSSKNSPPLKKSSNLSPKTNKRNNSIIINPRLIKIIKKDIPIECVLPNKFLNVFSQIKNLINTTKKNFDQLTKVKENDIFFATFNNIKEEIIKINNFVKNQKQSHVSEKDESSCKLINDTSADCNPVKPTNLDSINVDNDDPLKSIIIKNLNQINSSSDKRISIYKNFFDIYSQSVKEVSGIICETYSKKEKGHQKVNFYEQATSDIDNNIIVSSILDKLATSKSKQNLVIKTTRNSNKNLTSKIIKIMSRRLMSKKLIGYCMEENDEVLDNISESMMSEGARVLIPHKSYNVNKPTDNQLNYKIFTDGDLLDSSSYTGESILDFNIDDFSEISESTLNFESNQNHFNKKEKGFMKTRSRSLLNIKKNREFSKIFDISEEKRENKKKEDNVKELKLKNKNYYHNNDTDVIHLFNDASVSHISDSDSGSNLENNYPMVENESYSDPHIIKKSILNLKGNFLSKDNDTNKYENNFKNLKYSKENMDIIYEHYKFRKFKFNKS